MRMQDDFCPLAQFHPLPLAEGVDGSSRSLPVMRGGQKHLMRGVMQFGFVVSFGVCFCLNYHDMRCFFSIQRRSIKISFLVFSLLPLPSLRGILNVYREEEYRVKRKEKSITMRMQVTVARWRNFTLFLSQKVSMVHHVPCPS
jgi:hypothetical protein